jgi:hypothetical protein
MSADRCDNCKKKGRCPVGSPPQNVIMGKACQALKEHCKEGLCPEEPMDWIRGWIEGKNEYHDTH